MRICVLLFSLATFSSPVFSESYPLNARFEKLLPNEAQLIDKVRNGILFLQEAEHKAHGKVLRGTHAKGTCLAGQLEIYDLQKVMPKMSGRLKKGIFSVPGKYSTDIRFANAKGDINPDSDRDVRAVSLSVHMPKEISNPQGLMDFTMNDAPTFPINDAQVFADLMTGAMEGFMKTGKDIGPGRSVDVGGAIFRGKVLQEHWGTTPYQQLHYWSDVPFALGADEAVKYKLEPCNDNPAATLKSTDPDDMRNELIRHVTSDKQMSCFNFRVQLLDASRMTHGFYPFLESESESWWVENAAAEWDEDEAPFYSVGRLTLTANSIVDKDVCESRWVSVTKNTNETHHGLGSINRARGAAEDASFEARSKK